MLRGYRSLSLLVVIVYAAMGCAVAPDPIPDTQEEESRILAEGIWDVETGEKIDLGLFVEYHIDARFVLVAESHGDPWHHEAQRRIYEEFSDRRPGSVVLGMEMVERRFQDMLDAYIAEEVDEEQMLVGVEWEQRWGIDPELYSPIWWRARQEKQPVVGLNAPRELVRRVGEVGLDGLDEAEREQLPEIDVENDAYREHLRSTFEAHGAEGSSEELDRFYEAMLVWDETMAETAYEFMVPRPDEELMVILTGRGHVERGYGIPSRLVRRGAKSEAVITIFPVSTTGPRSSMVEDYRDLEFLRSEEIADYVWIETEQ